MDDSELRDHDPSSEPQPRHVARHNILGGCIKMRFSGCATGGDGKRSGTEIRNRGHWAFIKIGTLKASRRLRKGSRTRTRCWQPCRQSGTTSRTRRSGLCVCYTTYTRRASPRSGNLLLELLAARLSFAISAVCRVSYFRSIPLSLSSPQAARKSLPAPIAAGGLLGPGEGRDVLVTIWRFAVAKAIEVRKPVELQPKGA
jgi:hypothetical protein